VAESSVRQPLVAQFADAVTEHCIDEQITAACILVNNATDTKWFQRLLEFASAVCFIRGRVKFIHPEGKPSQPLQGQAVLYMGRDCSEFVSQFRKFGVVLYG